MKHIIKSGIKTILKNHAIIYISLLMMAFSGCDMGSSDSATDDQVRQVAEQADSIGLDLESLASLVSQLQTIDEEGGTEVNAEDITALYSELQAKLDTFQTSVQGIPGIDESGNIAALMDILNDYSGLSDDDLGDVYVDDYITLLENLASLFLGVEDTDGLDSLLEAMPQINLDLMTAILPVQLKEFAGMVIEAFSTLAQIMGLDPSQFGIQYDEVTAKVLFSDYDISGFIDLLKQLKNEPVVEDTGVRAAYDFTIISADDLSPIISFILGLLGTGTGDDMQLDSSDPAAIADLILSYISGVNIIVGQDQLVDFIDLLLPVLEQVNPQQADPATAGTELSINSVLVYQISDMMDAFADLLDTIWIFGFDLNEELLTPIGLSSELVRSAALQIDEIALAIAQTETTE